jgi:hypothetical protein
MIGERFLRSRGFGIHSPFAYNLVTQVIGEKTPYYCYEEIKETARNLVRHEQIISSSTGQMIFRLTNHFKPAAILYAGIYPELPVSYLTAFRSGQTCHVVNTSEIDCSDLSLSSVTGTDASPDFAMFCRPKGTNDVNILPLLRQCCNNANDNAVIILNDVRHGNMSQAWKYLRLLPQATLTLDVRDVGIAVFRNKLHKQHYKI